MRAGGRANRMRAHPHDRAQRMQLRTFVADLRQAVQAHFRLLPRPDEAGGGCPLSEDAEGAASQSAAARDPGGGTFCCMRRWAK
jgi:hypothetical protein